MLKKTRNLKIRILFLVVISIFCTSLFVTAAPTKEETKKEIEEAVTAIQQYSKTQKDEALAKAREMMDNFDKQVETWEAEVEQKGAEMKASSQEKYKQSIKLIQQKRNELSEWYGSMKYSTDKAWNEVKGGFAETYENAVTAFEAGRKEAAADQAKE